MGSEPAIAVIPCRLGASRLPGKPLLELHGRPMVAWVIDRCHAAKAVGRVIVATDDEGIAAAARTAGAQAVMTRSDHATGSDRIAEVVAGLALHPEALLINVQGDEPLIDPATIDAVLAALADPDIHVATACAPMVGDPADPARVKVVVDARGRALYFSRAPVPHGGPHQVHLGIYAFRAHALLRFAGLARGPLEQAERLEQLRLLEHGVPLAVVAVPHHQPSVDTPQDLDRVRALMAPGLAAVPGGPVVR